MAGLTAALGNDEEFLAGVQQELEKTHGTPQGAALLDEMPNIRAKWKEWKESQNIEPMQTMLRLIADEGAKFRDQIGSLQPREATRKNMSPFSVPPEDVALPENVAPLGRTLFTDYLLPVELGGTLLLVATIGAIAITGRRQEAKR